jgi:heavy metal sensor kinase
MNTRSLAFRLGAWYTLLLGTAFVFVGAATYFGLNQYLNSSLRDSLSRRSQQVEQILRQAASQATDISIAREIETRIAPEFNNRFVRVTRLPSTVVYRSGPPADRSFEPAAVGPRPFARAFRDSLPVSNVGVQQGIMIRNTPLRTESGEYVIEFGVSIEAVRAVLKQLLYLLILLLPGLLLCAAGGAYWLVNRALLPVDRLSQTAEQMSLQDLTLRLPVANTGDALERLSISLNNMLGRLRNSVQTSRRFLADASHELRTPLTVIKGELQELMHATHLAEDELHERVGSVLEEVARLEHLVSGLLVLSRLDAGEPRTAWTDVDLAELAMSTAEQMRLIAEDRGVAIDLFKLHPAMVQGDQAKLKQIIVNLLDNAIRFTPRGGCVRLRTEIEEGGVVLEITDTGIGIPAEAVVHVFERFYRVEEARSREDGGAGLGLSIVNSICSALGAEIGVRSRLGEGSSFLVRFPNQRDASLLDGHGLRGCTDASDLAAGVLPS